MHVTLTVFHYFNLQDIKILGTDMESCLPTRHQYFQVGKKNSHLFMREEEVMLEEDFLGEQQREPSRKPRPPRDSQPSSQQPLQEKPAVPPREPLNPEDPTKLAEQMGVGHTKFMKEQSDILEKAAEGKRKKEVKEALHVPPDESLHQERLLRQFTEEKKRKEDQRKMSGSNPGPPRRGEHIYNIPLNPSSPATLAGGGVQPQHKPPVSQGYTNPDPRQNHPGVSAGGVPSTQGGLSVNTQHSPNLRQQAGSTVAYAGHTHALDVGSPVQLVQDPNHHGVVMWLGTLPEARGLVAGVELVSI